MTASAITGAVFHVIREFHQRHPDIGQREIAKAVGASLGTVNETIKNCPSVQNEQLDRTVGGDGRERPATAEKAEQQRETIRETIVQHPEKSDREMQRATAHLAHLPAWLHVIHAREMQPMDVLIFNTSPELHVTHAREMQQWAPVTPETPVYLIWIVDVIHKKFNVRKMRTLKIL